jgi:adenylate kinase family enzyme
VDDTDEAITKRLGIYFDSVPHLNKAFEGKAHLHEFEGNRKVYEVHADVLERLFDVE